MQQYQSPCFMTKKNPPSKEYTDNLGYKSFCISFIWLYHIHYSHKYSQQPSVFSPYDIKDQKILKKFHKKKDTEKLINKCKCWCISKMHYAMCMTMQ